MSKRVMIVGPARSGKTTLANLLNHVQGPARRTQDIIYGKNTIDVPSAFIENTWMYKHLIALAQQASHVLILIDPSKKTAVYSPGFAKAFQCPVIGVITKADEMGENEAQGLQQLREIGINPPYYLISVSMNIGLEALRARLFLE